VVPEYHLASESAFIVDLDIEVLASLRPADNPELDVWYRTSITFRRRVERLT
jgi:hypothetical protein